MELVPTGVDTGPVRIDAVTEVEYLGSGQYLFRLASGTALGSGPACRERVREAFALRGPRRLHAVAWRPAAQGHHCR